MTTNTTAIAAAEALALHSLVAPSADGIGRRVLAKTTGGSVTLFAFGTGRRLAEHTSPLDVLVLVLEGSLTLRIGGTPVHATPGTLVRLPGQVPHAFEAAEPARMLLVNLRELAGSIASATVPVGHPAHEGATP